MVHYGEDVEKLYWKCNINIEKKPCWSKKLPEALRDFAVTDAIEKSATVNPEILFHADIFLPILDCMLSELDRRFSCDSKEMLRGTSALSPTCEGFLEYQALKEMALKYQLCCDGLVNEIPLVKRLVGDKCKRF